MSHILRHIKSPSSEGIDYLIDYENVSVQFTRSYKYISIAIHHVSYIFINITVTVTVLDNSVGFVKFVQ